MSAHKYTGSPLYRVRSRRPEEADADETIGERCARWAWSGGTPGAVRIDPVFAVAQFDDDPLDVRDIDDTEEDGFAPDHEGRRGAAA